ncbi:MAG: haloalkane dehalogenase [Gammaproteobacteria bacterium]|nr:haloalkane dehalogenase [Gammaproteobacteria bacterium]
MKILRTPDDRFNDLLDFPYKPNYFDYMHSEHSFRVHYVDEGPADADVTWLCLHGQPTWSYLYRKMIPVFVKAGHRVVAPDFIGFGRSDKSDDEILYTFDFHREMLLFFLRRLKLQKVRLVCQDWGGIIGLTLPVSEPEIFSALLVMNTTLGTGDKPLGKGFLAWRDFVRSKPDLNISRLMKRTVDCLSDDESIAYDAPFPDITYKAGVRRFPELLPDNVNAPGALLSRQARTWWKTQWQGQSAMVIGMQDPVLGPKIMNELLSSINNCPTPIEIPNAGHFVQEWGEPIARMAVEAF